MLRLSGLSGVVSLSSRSLRLPLALIAVTGALHGAYASDDGLLDRTEPTEMSLDASRAPAGEDPAWRAPDAFSADRRIRYDDEWAVDVYWQTRNSEALPFTTLPSETSPADAPLAPDPLRTPSVPFSEFATSSAPTEPPISVKPFVSVMVVGLLILSLTLVASINSRRQWRIESPASKIGTLADQKAYGTRRWLGPRRMPIGDPGAAAPARARWIA